MTSLQIKKIKPEIRSVMYNDGGGLYLRATKFQTKDTKEWIFRFTSPITGKRRKRTIGTFPTTDLKDARNYAEADRKLLQLNLDPIEEAQKKRQQEAEKHRENLKRNAKTVKVVFYEWQASELKNRKDKGKEFERIFTKDVFPLMGNKPIHSVTRDDIKNVLDRPFKRGAKRMTNEVLTALKQFFRYADDDELIAANPTRKFTKARAGGKQLARTRVLNEDELGLFNLKLKVSDIPAQHKHAICLYLSTGCRRTEIATTELKSIDLKNRYLNIPSDKAKNTDEHNIYLSDFALMHVEKLISLGNSDTWLIPNEENNGHLSACVTSRHIRLRQPQENEPGNSKWQRNYTDEFALPGGHWTLHDLRRTAATIMQKLGVMPHIVKKCLNQRTDDPIMETYQRAELIEEQKQAFIKLGDYLAEIFNYCKPELMVPVS